jgi:hypothetical protein
VGGGILPIAEDDRETVSVEDEPESAPRRLVKELGVPLHLEVVHAGARR